MFWKFIRILAEMKLINFIAASLNQERERERERNYYSTLLYENVKAMIQYWYEKSILQFRAMIFLSIHNNQNFYSVQLCFYHLRMEINFYQLEKE